MHIIEDESGQVLKLAGNLDIGVAEELRNVLHDFLNGVTAPIIDLSGVEECDTAALQLLYSARKTVEFSGGRLELTGLSDAVRDTSAALGLTLLEGGDERKHKDAA